MEVELQGAGIRRGYVHGGSRAAGGVSEGKIRLRQPLTGQGARRRQAPSIWDPLFRKNPEARRTQKEKNTSPNF